MVDYFTDSTSLHIRDSIRLNQQVLTDMLAGIAGLGTRYLVARNIDLDDVVFVDRDVVLLADTVTATAPGRVQITLKRSGSAKDGVLTQAGQVEPPEPVLGEPPHAGAAGHTLTILCRTLLAGKGESHGQQGGKGLRGPHENRNWCREHFNPIPELNPCSNMDPSDLPELVGSRGGKGLPGGAGGPGGTIRVLCLQDKSGGGTSWVGVGGPGGLGGDGGRGGANGEGAPGTRPRGPDGFPGDRPDPPPPISHQVQVVTESTLATEITDLSTAIRVGFETFEHHPVGRLWAQFRIRQAASHLRNREFARTHEELVAVSRLAPDTPGLDDLRRRLRDHTTPLGVERDLDLPADVPLFSAEIINEPLAMLTRLTQACAPLSPAVGGQPSKLLNPALARSTFINLGGVLALWLDKDEVDEQNTAAGERETLARRSRKSAHKSRLTARDRLLAILSDPANAGVTVRVPDLPSPLSVGALAVLAADLVALAPQIAADDDAGSPTTPSNDVAGLLPGGVDLLVHRTTRTSGANGVFPAPAADLRPGAMDVRHSVTWNQVGSPNTTGVAVNLQKITAQLRAALRPPGAPVLTDPVRLVIVESLIELAEATHSWRLADLRLEQAKRAVALTPSTRAAATAALELPTPVEGSPLSAVIGPLLTRLRAVSDLIEWRWHRMERAFDLYTLGLSFLAIDRTAHAELFAPGNEAALVADTHGVVAATPASLAGGKIVGGIQRIGTAQVEPAWQAYDARGDRTLSTPDQLPFPARRVFCREAGGDCAAAATHVFTALQKSNPAAFWFDVDLSDVQGPHREAKLRGAYVRIDYNLGPLASGSPPQPAQKYRIELQHGGFGRQRQLGAEAEHASVALPQPMGFDLERAKVEGVLQSYWEGEITIDPPDIPGQPTPSPGAELKAYGRGAAAGYRLSIAESHSEAAPLRMTRVEVQINYEARQPKGTSNLRSVTLTSALRVGSTASALIRVTAPAPAGGTVVKLASSDPTTLSVPGQVVVLAGATAATAPVQVLKATGPIPPTLRAATLDGVSRRALAPVVTAEPLEARSAVLGAVDGATYAVAVGRFATGPGGSRPAPTVLVSRTGPFFPEEPVGDGPFNAIHAVRADLTEIRRRDIGVWPRSIALDEKRRRVYVVHGQTVSSLDAGSLATLATRTIGNNASMVAVDVAANLVYVTRYSEGQIYVLRGDDLGVVQIFGDKPTLRGCLGIAVHPDGGRLYVARNFRIADPTATAVTSIVRRPDGSHVIDRDAPFGPVLLQPHEIAVDGPAGLVFVTCQGGGGVHPTLLALDARTLETVSTVVVPGPGMSVAARPGTGIAYLACYSGLVLVDARAGSISLTVKARTHPQGVAVDPVTGTAYLTDRSDRTVTRIETPPTVTTRDWR